MFEWKLAFIMVSSLMKIVCVMVNFTSLHELITGNKSDHELSNYGYLPHQHFC